MIVLSRTITCTCSFAFATPSPVFAVVPALFASRGFLWSPPFVSCFAHVQFVFGLSSTPPYVYLCVSVRCGNLFKLEVSSGRGCFAEPLPFSSSCCKDAYILDSCLDGRGFFLPCKFRCVLRRIPEPWQPVLPQRPVGLDQCRYVHQEYPIFQ